jgi:DNA invertase Pin-like site-specific DNA recombinase
VRAEGKTLGRPFKTTPEQRNEFIRGYAEKQGVNALARFYSISRATLLTIVAPTTSF